MPLGIFAMLAFTSCDVMNEVAETLVDTTENGISTTTPALTNSEVIAGLKEALNVGIQNSVDVTSITDGFWKNDAIKLPFPEDANMVKEKALSWGLDGQVEKFELTLNRAAEEATKEALPIFKNAILGMSISDGFAILNGGEGAATPIFERQYNK